MSRLAFDEKARENLEAVERLNADDDGLVEALRNALANRAYYAAYQAVAHIAQERSLGFTSSTNDYYRHDTLPEFARRNGILDDDGRHDLVELYSLRVKADYLEDPVELDEADHAATLAKRLVEGLLR